MLIGFPPLSRLAGRSSRDAQQVRIVPPTNRTRDLIEELLVADPVRGVHVAARMRGGAVLDGPAVFAIVSGEAVLGAASAQRGFSWLLAPEYRLDRDVHAALASFVATRAGETDVVVGPAGEVAGVLAALRARNVIEAEIREQLMMVSPGTAVPPAPRRPQTIRTAGMSDLRWLLEAHAGMCREDLGVDQVARNRSGYEAYFRELIAGGRVWIGEAAEGRVFKAEVALRSPGAWLIEGVYTVPEARRAGFAKHAMATIAAEAARHGRLACLYVHRKNVAAVGVYRAVGFEDVCPWSTAFIVRGRAAPPRWFSRRI